MLKLHTFKTDLKKQKTGFCGLEKITYKVHNGVKNLAVSWEMFFLLSH